MSKKKNTLKDLDEFLKQQAATLVSPDRLSQEVVEPEPIKPAVTQPVTPEEISAEKILHDLKELYKKEGTLFKNNLYDLIIQSLETQQHTSPEDKMLINTALYLKGGENWKEVIKNYWKNKL